jgi:predicted nucleic acid-binding protein
LQPLGEFAFRFLKECLKHKFRIIYSDITIKELRKAYSEEKIQEMLVPFKEIIEKVKLNDGQILESAKLETEKEEIPQPDILHAILARDNKAIMIARDCHFESLKEIVEILKPENIHF